MNKNILTMIAGILIGLAVAKVGYELNGKHMLKEAGYDVGSVQHEQVILGHRIGPGGQEMLVVAK